MTWNKKKKATVVVEKAERPIDAYSLQRGKVEGLAIACAYLQEHDAARRIVRAILKQNERRLEEELAHG